MSASLYDRWLDLRARSPRLFPRDAAVLLGCSEAELVAVSPSSLLLAPSVAEIFRSLPSVGEVKTITRNEHAVIEKWGRFEAVEVGSGHAGQVVGEEIDLRVFPARFRFGFFVSEETPRGRRDSFQFYDEHGDSVHKVYAESEETARAMRALAARHLAPEPTAAAERLPVAPRPSREPRTDLSLVAAEAFRAAWDAMTDTHDFFGLLRRFRIGRVQGLELAGADRAREVDPGALAVLLARAADAALPIMVFVGSRGVIQIHTGPVRAVVAQGGYLNVLDRRFNLHVREGAVARAFVVRKPTNDGVVTSLELYDHNDETIALLFSKRKPGQVETPLWRAMLTHLHPAEAA
ncbi:MAG: ChuX/HutX family heme-like substrate-binding protein [Polyangiaceae bacterium]